MVALQIKRPCACHARLCKTDQPRHQDGPLLILASAHGLQDRQMEDLQKAKQRLSDRQRMQIEQTHHKFTGMQQAALVDIPALLSIAWKLLY